MGGEIIQSLWFKMKKIQQLQNCNIDDSVKKKLTATNFADTSVSGTDVARIRC
jgi:hypothetical protein